MTVVSEVVATAAQKETLDFTRILPTIIMVAGYVSSFVFRLSCSVSSPGSYGHCLCRLGRSFHRSGQSCRLDLLP
ncbi:DMT family transporter [Acetobacter senegalensis]|uniref:hypothetical protein n=1 Tax=Acetobacter senegalensis TaxID=446692 RepID=UPI002ED3BD4F